MPHFGGQESFFNGIYEALGVVFLFPLIIIIGAGSNEMDPITSQICKFLGNMSYPIYVTHYPLICLHFRWSHEFTNAHYFNRVWVALFVLCFATYNAYSLLTLYDEPLRKWLTDRYIRKKPAAPKQDVIKILADDKKNELGEGLFRASVPSEEKKE